MAAQSMYPFVETIGPSGAHRYFLPERREFYLGPIRVHMATNPSRDFDYIEPRVKVLWTKSQGGNETSLICERATSQMERAAKPQRRIE